MSDLSPESLALVQRTVDLFEHEPAREKLTAWQKSFMEDQVKRWLEWGDAIRMSPKQLIQVKKAHDAMAGETIDDGIPY